MTNKMKGFLFFILTVCLTPTSNARLGETVSQLIERFGQPKARGPEQTISDGYAITIGDRFTFENDGWTISAIIIDQKCSKIIYFKPGSWSEEQITQTLNANSQGAKWELTSNAVTIKYNREWTRQDHGTAKWDALGFTLTHPAFERATEKAKARAKAEARRSPNI